jgi:nucleoside-diphosphate-sugar epimerase
MIHLALDDRALTIYGDGRQVRDYIYVADLVEAFVAVGASAGTDGRAYNVGSGVGTPLVDMAAAIVARAGSGRLEYQPWPKLAEQIETGDFVADVSRLKADTGWQPATSLDDGLEKTVDAYRVRTGA